MANAAAESEESGATVVTMVIESRSPHETKSWGRRLASLLEGGELLGLIGDLGAGKTCFIKGLARGLSLREEDIVSPTFTMIQEHHGRFPLYHIDLYRLEEATLDDLGLREYLFSEGVAAVEWFERLRGGAEMEYLAVRISYAGANIRRIELSAVDSRHSQIISKLKRRFA
ncbi:tRNA (adenosine(37)-N6)-threonylcarbamoyltransferase complex ATPase subunit type 1 TsaE [Candidatus Binatus sp.]|jgi:tRNA threonylcarbamoyladenosine biosynthesis protein TsaE|uniref:tRNA (adenosine(37)-N6)-threonylcarbamoyltransferase complex ATPase subunit type 1 TsaE n=1 Tax=Candidatus Binatus sp. TaxID=2811406 RepID=UPI003BD6188B